MPYITEYDRARLDPRCEPENVGELNYVITKLVDKFLGENFRYSDINDAIGVLECAKLELYRRLAAPYEDHKKEENGDVYSQRGER